MKWIGKGTYQRLERDDGPEEGMASAFDVTPKVCEPTL